MSVLNSDNLEHKETKLSKFLAKNAALLIGLCFVAFVLITAVCFVSPNNALTKPSNRIDNNATIQNEPDLRLPQRVVRNIDQGK